MVATRPSAAFDLTQAPLCVGRVRLRVRDGARVAGFYERVLGLTRLAETPARISLGAGGTGLLDLLVDPGTVPAPAGSAGLFHTAFLLPTRGDLGRWLAHARALGVRIDGSADHGVSEAVYLADPEGNGIELYADRPPADWGLENGWVAMPNNPLDLDGLDAAAGGRAWAGAPADTTVGHLHLKVGHTGKAERMYAEVLGFDVTYRLGGGELLRRGRLSPPAGRQHLAQRGCTGPAGGHDGARRLRVDRARSRPSGRRGEARGCGRLPGRVGRRGGHPTRPIGHFAHAAAGVTCWRPRTRKAAGAPWQPAAFTHISRRPPVPSGRRRDRKRL